MLASNVIQLFENLLYFYFSKIYLFYLQAILGNALEGYSHSSQKLSSEEFYVKEILIVVGVLMFYNFHIFYAFMLW